jgi:ligand-binding sensor domain-containing protein
MWIATYRGGLCKFDPRKKTFETFTYDSKDTTTLSSEGVTSLFIDSHQNLWVGTIEGLNVKGTASEFFQKIPVHKAGIQRPSVITTSFRVYEDRQNRMWIGTRGNGLNLFLKGSDKFKHIGTQHGLPGNAIYGVQEDQNGYLWVSTENGISKLNPADFSCA